MVGCFLHAKADLDQDNRLYISYQSANVNHNLIGPIPNSIMKRAELTGVNKPLEIVTCDIPTPPEDGCIVRTTYAGVCHSDIHLMEDKFGLGHGNAMVVSEVLKMRSM